MPGIEFASEQALFSAIRHADRPLAFLVGAPLSAPERAGALGVPGVAGMVELVKAKITHDGDLLLYLDRLLTAAPAARQYQTAMQFLQSWVSQDAVNQVVRQAVRMARRAGPNERLTDAELDADLDGWVLRPGVEALATVLVQMSRQFAGLVLTTNFDPLLSIAIQRKGGAAHRIVLHVDGSLSQSHVDHPVVGTVVHLHGYWRVGDTLHTPAQLTAPRPLLKSALGELLRSRALVVVAYGGWDDIFTQALVETVHSEGSDVDVLWTFYDNDPDVIIGRNKSLLDMLAPALSRGRVRFYRGVDSHKLFPELLRQFAPLQPSPERQPPEVVEPGSPLTGWVLVDRKFLSKSAELTPGELLRYFDGQVPSWRHAISPKIPRRGLVRVIRNAFEKAALQRSGGLLRVVVGAGGEGKSTVLRQVAADLALQGNRWRVLWRPELEIGLPLEQLCSLEAGEQLWLLVADDADSLVSDLQKAVKALHELGRRDIYFLVCARDTDWRAAGGQKVSWSQYITFHQDLLRGLDRLDAVGIVRAWAAIGSEGLGKLADRTGEQKRVEALLEAATREAANRYEGAFLGAMLRVRFGASLGDHVKTMMLRLQGRPVSDRRTLYDAFLNIAAVHALGIPGIDVAVLADLLGVPRGRLRAAVELPLGEEAAGVHAGTALQARHRAIAECAVRLAEQELDEDLVGIYASIVRQTIRTQKGGTRVYPHAAVIYVSQRLLDSPLFKDGPMLARAAAEATLREAPERLGLLTNLCTTLRKMGKPEEAIQRFRSILSAAESKVDFATHAPAFFYEWAVAEGECGRYELNAWLAGVSISDDLNSAELIEEHAMLSLAGLGVAFSELAAKTGERDFAQGLQAIVTLGFPLATADERARAYFRRHSRNAARLGASKTTIEVAIDDLSGAIIKAWELRENELPPNVPNPGQLSFGLLETLVQGKTGKK